MDGPAAGGDSPTAIERWRAFDATVHARLADSPRPAAVEHLTLDGFRDVHRYLPSGSATAVLVVLAVTVFIVGAFSLLIVALEGTPLFLVLIGVIALFAFLSDAVPDVIFWVLFGGGVTVASLLFIVIYGTFGLGVSVGLWFIFLYAYYHEGNGVLAEASGEEVRESLFALLPGLFLAAVFLLGLFWTTLLTLWAVFVMPWSTLPGLIGIVAIIYYGGGYIRDAADETGSVSAVVTSAERVAESSLGRRTIDITTQSLGATIGGLGALTLMAVVFLVWLAAMVAILRNPIIMVAVFGLTLAYLGFIIFEFLLEFVGGAVGGVSGVIVLGVWLPRVLLGDPSWLVSLGLLGIGFVVGWWVGAMAMTLIHKLGILLTGFITVSGWTFALAAGVRTISEFTTVRPGDYKGAVAVAILGGLIGAVLAWKAYVAFVIATTAFLGGVTIGGIFLSVPIGTVVALTGALGQWILVRDNLEELAQIGAAEGDPEPALATR